MSFSNKQKIVTVLLVLLVAQFASRYLPNVSVGMVADDWRSLYWGRTMSWEVILSQTRAELDRPLCMLAIPSTFKLMDDHRVAFAGLGIFYNSLSLMLLFLMSYSLTRSLVSATLAGLAFAAMPNVTESFHWAHHVSIGFMHVGYVACMLFACWYLRHGRWWMLGASLLAYAMGVFCYESGMLVPCALLALVTRQNQGRWWTVVGVFSAVVGAFVLWRIGLGGASRHILNYRDYLEQSPTLYDVLYNIRLVVSWWCGEEWLRCIVNGVSGFLDWPGPLQWALLAVNALTVIGALRLACTVEPEGKEVAESWFRVAAFSLLWVGAACMPAVIAWPAGRLNYLPAAGVALLVACLPWSRRHKFGLAAVMVFLFAVNQGTSRHWYESALYQQKMYQHLADHEAEWRGKDVLFVDTQRLRQRLTRGLLSPISSAEYGWSRYGNALLARSFVPDAMLDLICLSSSNPVRPKVVLDVEYGAQTESDRLVWYGRFNKQVTNELGWDRIYGLDAFDLSTRQPHAGR